MHSDFSLSGTESFYKVANVCKLVNVGLLVQGVCCHETCLIRRIIISFHLNEVITFENCAIAVMVSCKYVSSAACLVQFIVSVSRFYITLWLDTHYAIP